MNCSSIYSISRRQHRALVWIVYLVHTQTAFCLHSMRTHERLPFDTMAVGIDTKTAHAQLNRVIHYANRVEPYRCSCSTYACPGRNACIPIVRVRACDRETCEHHPYALGQQAGKQASQQARARFDVVVQIRKFTVGVRWAVNFRRDVPTACTTHAHTKKKPLRTPPAH